MLSLRLPDELETRLTQAARASGRSKAEIARNALNDYLEEMEYYRDAVEVLRRHEPTVTLDELEWETLRPEYDFSAMSGGVRGKYAERYRLESERLPG